MGERTGVSWCDHTFNPWWGCTKKSSACAHCYAEKMAHRFGTEWGPKAERRFFGDAHWSKPLVWAEKAKKKGVRRRVFCASMADVFENHEDVRMWQARERLWDLIEKTSDSLDWLLLTKRPANIRQMVRAGWLCGNWPANAWVGITAENQACYDGRIRYLMNVPAPVRFLSCEPLLGKVTILDQVDWVIAGGESGPKARPMHPDWVAWIKIQCDALKIPFHFKQWGAWAPGHTYDFYPESSPLWHVKLNGEMSWIAGDLESPSNWSTNFESTDYAMEMVGKKKAGSLLYGREWKQFPAPRKVILP